MKAPSQRTVRVAARLCSIIASTPGMLVAYGWRDVPGVNWLAYELADRAHRRAMQSPCARDFESIGEYESWCWAEAERLLREGWRP